MTRDDEQEQQQRRSDGPRRPESPAGRGEDDIEILGVSAADEAGVPLEEADVAGPAGADAGLAARLRAEQQQASQLREQLLRTAADFENYRKRMERDRVEERKQAAAGLVRNLVPVLDSFRRALAQAAEPTTSDTALRSFVEGVKLIHSQLLDILGSAGLEPVDTSGAFDPAVHEALMQEPSTTARHLDVLEVLEPGYRFGGRLLRPARVKVAFNPGSGGGTNDGASGDGDEPTHADAAGVD